MSHATAASRSSSFRRRGRGTASVSTMAVDTRYRDSAIRRSPRVRPLPVVEAPAEIWPDWVVPSSLVAVMATISAYHYDALLAALRTVILG